MNRKESGVELLGAELLRVNVSLGQLLTEAVFSPTISIPDNITTIDLEEFGRRANNLLRETRQDPERRERGKVAVIDWWKRLSVLADDFIGSHKSVNMTPNQETLLPRHLRQDIFVALTIHSHNKNLPPSYGDLSFLFYREDNVMALPALLVVNATLKMLVCRSKKTPQWNDQEVDRQRELWRELLMEKIYEYSANKNAIGETKALIPANYYCLKFLARRYNLSVYSCPVSKNIAVRETL